jgi:hypothetical protein
VTLPSPSRPVLICLAVCALILVVAGIDLAHTTTRLPDFPSRDCQSDQATCFNAQLSERLARARAAEPLQREYDSRSWLYAFAIVATAAVATAWSMRVNPRSEWLRIFTNVGVIGVWLGIGVIVVLVTTDGNALAPPAAPMLMLPVVFLVAAGAGTLVGRSEGWAEQSPVDGIRERVLHVGKLAIHIGTRGQAKRSRMEELARWLANAAVALTAVTCALALIFVLAQPGCASGGGPPQWTDPIDAIAAVGAVAGVAAGVGALVFRRWIAALVSLIGCPVALLLVLVSTCTFS